MCCGEGCGNQIPVLEVHLQSNRWLDRKFLTESVRQAGLLAQ